MHRAILEGTAANDSDRQSKIQRRQIHMGLLTIVLQNRNAILQYRITIVLLLMHGNHTGIVTANTPIPIFVQISRQILIRKEYLQVFGTQERIGTNVFYFGRNRKFRQALASIESIAANIGHSFRQFQCRKAFAETECEIVHIGQFCIAKINGSQLIDTLQAMRLNAGQCSSGQEGNALQIAAAIKHIRRDAPQLAIFRKGEFRQISATHKCTLGYR